MSQNYSDTPVAAWIPTAEFIQTTHLAQAMQELGFSDYKKFHAWSVENYSDYWSYIIQKLNIQFDQQYSAIVDLSAGIEFPKWLPDAKLNIARSCFNAPKNALAVIYQTENGDVTQLTYQELDQLSNRVANSLTKHFKPGDAIGVCMPMTAECIAIYLGIIKAGCVVVSIADSFSADEIATRLRIANAKATFTQDCILRGNKRLPLYQKLLDAKSVLNIVIPVEQKLSETLKNKDQSWETFLDANTDFNAVSCTPQATINILFSSGTTGEPKAIPWTQTTPIKCAADAYFHHNVQIGDRFAWPTNIGWMMGPWLIFAALMNQGTIALYGGTPLGRAFGEFIQNQKINILGLVPTLVKSWRAANCMENLDWNAIKLFSSTGECSNVDDMLYLMSLANNKPIIEYCGGTEVVCYITSTLIQPNIPSAFSTPALGIDFALLDEQGNETNNGEVALIPPSIGLSTELLNKDHHQTYYADMPKSASGKILRRHGDQIKKFANGYFRALGRVDDTMNLGGIKISSAEIERTLTAIPEIIETAAIAINPPGGGPSRLVIYVVPKADVTLNKVELKITMQSLIKEHLNPLFKIHDVVLINSLPRTASNKVMRRVLRDEYVQM